MKELLNKMLKFNPKERLRWDQIHMHPIFDDTNSSFYLNQNYRDRYQAHDQGDLRSSGNLKISFYKKYMSNDDEYDKRTIIPKRK